MFKVGIDHYGLFPLGLDPMETMQWALDHGAGGVAFSGLDESQRGKLDYGQLIRLKDFAEENNLYLEWGGGQHIPRDLTTWEKKDLFTYNQTAAEEAKALGTRIIRSCSGGLMRWNPASLPTQQLLNEMIVALSAQKQMLMDHNVILAIETHFEFTTFELLRVFEACGAKPGEWLGICLDTMNLLTMLEDPVMATKRVLPWVVSTHIKDGGLQVTSCGFNSFPAPFGEGVIDFDRIFALLADAFGEGACEAPLHLNVEDHGGDFDIPVFDPEFRKQFPDLTDEEMQKLVVLSEKTKQKMDKGTLAILDRKDWAGVCEGRMAGNVQSLKNLVG
ncbi:MAG: sugar phosphate isomerase/epimerase [Porphyromonadaceae bacterium]|nr:MAG: sugar phosphate isomerase/epimerase [Porphyromonadaceae bacterium]